VAEGERGCIEGLREEAVEREGAGEEGPGATGLGWGMPPTGVGGSESENFSSSSIDCHTRFLDHPFLQVGGLCGMQQKSVY
jgi:hypothetical protein